MEKTPLERQADHAAEKVRQAIADQRHPTWQNIALGVKRQFAISGLSVVGRIPYSSLVNVGISPFESLLARAASRISGIKGETEGTGTPREGAQAVIELFRRSTVDQDDGMLSAILGRGTELSRNYGEARRDSKWNIPAHTHEALTYPFQKLSFLASAKRYTRGLANAGVDVTSPEAVDMIGKKAYTDSLISTYRNENATSKVVRKIVGVINRQDETAGMLFESLIPVVNLPTNVAGRMGEYAAGIPYGAYKQIKAARAAKKLGRVEESLKDENLDEQTRQAFQAMADKLKSKQLTGDQRDAILRAYKRGAAGAVLMALGYYFSDEVDKLPDWMAAAPPIAALKWGGIIHKTFKDKNQDLLSKVASAGGQIGRKVAEALPETTDFQRPLNAALGNHPHDEDVSGAGKFLADYLMGWLEPAIVRNYAVSKDQPMVKKGAFYYRARGFREQVKKSLPIFRQTLQEKPVPRKKP